MKNLIRDFKILWSATWYVLKYTIIVNVVCFLVIYLLESTSPAGSYVLTLRDYIIMAVFIDTIVIGVMIHDYVTVWRKRIQNRIDEAEREKKYNFISQRFNDIN